MESYEEEDTINHLPDELLVKIFFYFTVKKLMCTIRLVCRRWCNISYDRNLWARLTSDDVQELKNHSIYDIVRRLFCFDESALKYLSLDRFDITHEDDLSWKFPSLIPNLNELSLAFCSQVDKSVLRIFSDSCRNIHSLNLEECNITNDCFPILNNQMNITKLNISYCNNLTDEFVIMISQWSLRDLNIDGVQWISDEAVEHLLHNCQHSLEHLWLDGENLTDDGLRLLQCCHNIKVLKISFCEQLTDVTLRIIAEMPGLTSLALRKGKNFSEDGIIFLFKNLCKGLYHLDFYDCQALNDEAVFWITQSSPHLTSLDLSWCWYITDEGLKNIVYCCRNIQKLILTGVHELTGEPFKEIPQRLPRLCYLDLCNCNSIIDEIIINIAEQNTSISILDYYGNAVK